jgi:hypothetical protein
MTMALPRSLLVMSIHMYVHVTTPRAVHSDPETSANGRISRDRDYTLMRNKALSIQSLQICKRTSSIIYKRLVLSSKSEREKATMN